MALRNNPISATIDFEQDGVQHGYLRQPYSRDDSAWGAIMTPITQLKNGDGSTVILTGGNHGDEYEGPLALFDFAARAAIEDIQGKVIIIPAMNYPAFAAGRRLSPIDGGNLNRLFPGQPDGTPTQVLADYFSRVLLPMADYVLDIHSGGKTLEFLPFAASHVLEDKTQEQRCTALRQAFAAPYQLQLLELDAAGMYDTQSEMMGKVFVSTELGGGGTTTPETVEIARRGVRNVLIHAGILAGEPESCPEGSTALEMSDLNCYVLSEDKGLVEPWVALGDQVQKGEILARVHAIDRTAGRVSEYRAAISGIVLGRHFSSLCQLGDVLFVVAEQLDG